MKRKDILYYLSSFLIFAVSFIFLLVAFHHQTRLIYFVICVITFALFCIIYKITSKKISCEDGYNLMQAYMFYRKCKANGFYKKPSKITQKDLEEIKRFSEEYDYASSFSLSQIKELYRNGYETEKIMKKKYKEN